MCHVLYVILFKNYNRNIIIYAMVHKKKKAFVKQDEPSETQPTYQNKIKDASVLFRAERRARLVVRNLPFRNLSEEKVRDIFAEFGNVIDVKLLTKDNGFLVGCGFVEFDKRRSAAKALYHTNGKIVGGRPIVVDWALPKSTFIDKVKQIGHVVEGAETNLDPNGTLDYAIDTRPDSGDESSEDEVEDKDDILNETKMSVESDEEGDSGEAEDDEDDVDEDETEDTTVIESEVPKKNLSTDVDEGKTVFIKNVAFAANNEDVKECLSKYGSINYAIICVDKLTEHSKGSAFVKFKEKESADKCIRDSNNIYLMDQPLQVTLALSKDKLEDEKKKRKTKVKDSRNLYLVREGTIMAGSPAAETVSPADMAKRLQIEQWKTQILRNLNMFVSKTRLVVHNLPPQYDDKKLRQLFVENAPSGAEVREARVMLDRKALDGKGNELSKEVGFVSFTSHEDALSALRKINNNPALFTTTRRPIVSFSIENREVLHIKQKRLEKSRAKLIGHAEKERGKGTDKLNSKVKRFLKRKEKIIAARQEAKMLKKEQEKAGKSGKKVKKKSGEANANVIANQREEKIKQKIRLGDKPAAEPSMSKNIGAIKKQKKSSAKKLQQQIEEDFGGFAAQPGKTPKMRSTLKLKTQMEKHKEKLKKLRKIRRSQKAKLVKKTIAKEKEQKVKRKGILNLEKDDKFAKMVSLYKSKLQNAETFRKWYDT